MKIFYKKDYLKVLKEKNDFEKLYNENLKRKAILNEENNNLKEQLHTSLITVDNFVKENKKLKEKLKIETGAKGGLTKEINKLNKEKETLKAEIEDLKKKLEESMSDKYLVKKIRGQKTPTQKTRITKTVKPNIRNYMQKEFD
jgi:cell division protein FtsB